MTVANRLWPLLASTFTAGVVGDLRPAGGGGGGGLRDHLGARVAAPGAAVAAIEERDAVRFYVDKTSPLSPIQLVRTPGFGGRS